MGLTINYRHRTKDFAKIRDLIMDLKAFAESTGRAFQWGVGEVFVSKYSGSEQHPEDEPYNYTFYGSGLSHLEGQYPKSKSIWFEMELKSSLGAEGTEWMGVMWGKVGDYWVANDFSKPPRPRAGVSEDQVARRVIEEVSILEYIQKYYFPNFKIDDEFDFHINYDDKRESQKQFWKDIKAGLRDAYRQDDGSFPDYKKQYLAKKNHDIKNIYRSFGDINRVFDKIEKQLADAGWSEKNIKRDMTVNTGSPKGKVARSTPVGDMLVEEMHDQINDVKTSVVRKRQITIPDPKKPIKKVLKRRKDGVYQHYYKRLDDKRGGRDA